MTRRRAPTGRSPYEFHTLTRDRWNDFETLFGPRGACAGCWCMWWRLRRSEWEANGNIGNRQAMKEIVDAGREPGVLAYDGGSPIGWCAVAPREEYGALERSRVLKRIDAKPVWSITCFFVLRPHRRRGVTADLVQAAVDHARARGALLIEAYPIEPGSRKVPAVYAYTGFASTFRKAGFRPMAHPAGRRAIWRKALRVRSAG